MNNSFIIHKHKCQQCIFFIIVWLVIWLNVGLSVQVESLLTGRLSRTGMKYSTSVLRWCCTGQFAMTIFSATQHCNVGTMLRAFKTMSQQFNVATLCWAKNRHCESSHVTLPIVIYLILLFIPLARCGRIGNSFTRTSCGKSNISWGKSTMNSVNLLCLRVIVDKSQFFTDIFMVCKCF